MSERNYPLFGESDSPTPRTAEKLWEDGKAFNAAISLEENVRVNENFYIGRQWEGVNSNGLPTPVLNFLKRVVGFQVATITSQSLTVNASALAGAGESGESERTVRAVNAEFGTLCEQNSLTDLARRLARAAAVDGDGCIYTYWDADFVGGSGAKGRIVSECIANTRVFFGDPNSREVQTQPWILIESREPLRSVKARAEEPEKIRAVTCPADGLSSKIRDERVSVLTVLWKDRSGIVRAAESCGGAVVRSEWSLGIRLYPVVWMCWDAVPDCYHGQAMISGLIPNQISVNKLWAMSLTSLTRSAWPKVIYDRTRVAQWDNRVGGAIAVNGGDMNSIARVIDPVGISPQVSQLIGLLVQQTQETLGATSVVLGDAKPENTSAIAALSKAAVTPVEMTRLSLYTALEELFRIYLEFMAEYYGKRVSELPPSEGLREAARYAGIGLPEKIRGYFDFRLLRSHPMTIRLDVGASSYFSEIQALQTLENLLKEGHISAVQYLERIPDGYVPDRRGLIDELSAENGAALPGQTE